MASEDELDQRRGGGCVPGALLRTCRAIERATARLWREGTGGVIQIDIDGAPCTEREYADLPNACHAIASMLRQRGGRAADLDESECEACDELLDLMTCSQCGVDAFLRTCEHGGPRAIRETEGAVFCRSCRP